MSIKSTVQWFPFLEMMEYTGNDMQDDTHLTASLLKMFSLFGIRLSCGDVDLDTVSSSLRLQIGSLSDDHIHR